MLSSTPLSHYPHLPPANDRTLNQRPPVLHPPPTRAFPSTRRHFTHDATQSSTPRTHIFPLGQVLVKMRASGICGSDLRVIYRERDPAQCEQVRLTAFYTQPHSSSASLTTLVDSSLMN